MYKGLVEMHENEMNIIKTTDAGNIILPKR